MDQRTKKIVIGAVIGGVLFSGIAVASKSGAGKIMIGSALGIIIGGGIGFVASAT